MFGIAFLLHIRVMFLPSVRNFVHRVSLCLGFLERYLHPHDPLQQFYHLLTRQLDYLCVSMERQCFVVLENRQQLTQSCMYDVTLQRH